MPTKLAICAALALATIFAFADVRNGEFLSFDDDTYVTDSPHVRNGLTVEGLRWSLTAVVSANWHPFTLHSHMLDVELFGLEPGAHHLMGLGFHVANTLLVFLLLVRMTGAVWRSAFVAALFGFHPVHVESVAWISERKDLLSTLCWLGSIHAWVSFTRGGSRAMYAASLALLCVGLLAKSMLVTLPFVLLLFDLWPLGRVPMRDALRLRGWWPRVREKLPFFAVIVAISAAAVFTQSRSGPMWSSEALPLADRAANALVSYVRYLGHIFWPVDLAIFYPHPLAWPPLPVAGAAALLLALTGLAAWQRERAPWALVGWLFFLGTLVPTLGLVQVGNAALSDRYLYVPVLGVFWTVAWGAHALLAGRERGGLVLGASAAAVLAACLLLTVQSVVRWRDTRSLFEFALEVTRPNPTAHATVAWLDLSEGKLDDALSQIDAAIGIEPRYALAHSYRGSILLRRGQVDDAIASYTRSLELRREASTLFQLGRAHEAARDPGSAELRYREGLELGADDPDVRIRLGWIRAQRGDLPGAASRFEEVLAAHPDDPAAHEGLGVTLEWMGDDDTAAEHYARALEGDRHARYALHRLGWIRASHPRSELRDAGEAVRLAELAASDSRGSEASELDLLAAAYAEAARFDEAVQIAERARQNARDADYAAAIERRLELYRKSLPYRRPATLRQGGGGE
jgi:tetratricopeptide (TPR) repeat protein